MSKFLRVIDNETIEIARYRNPRIAFNDPNYEDISSYCDLKAIINPFTLYEENEQLKYQLQQKENIIKEVREELNKIDSATYQGDTDKKTYYKYEQTRIQKLLEILERADNDNKR